MYIYRFAKAGPLGGWVDLRTFSFPRNLVSFQAPGLILAITCQRISIEEPSARRPCLKCLPKKSNIHSRSQKNVRSELFKSHPITQLKFPVFSLQDLLFEAYFLECRFEELYTPFLLF